MAGVGDVCVCVRARARFRKDHLSTAERVPRGLCSTVASAARRDVPACKCQGRKRCLAAAAALFLVNYSSHGLPSHQSHQCGDAGPRRNLHPSLRRCLPRGWELHLHCLWLRHASAYSHRLLRPFHQICPAPSPSPSTTLRSTLHVQHLLRTQNKLGA